MAALKFRPVTPTTLEDFEALFESRGGPSYCWCLAYRATSAEKRAASGKAGKPQMVKRIRQRVPVGLLGYLDGEPVAWVSVAPRDSFVSIGGAAAGDDETVWSLSCMFVRRDHRGSGRAHELIAGAIAYARRRKATILEAYPVDPDSPSYRHMGFVPAFRAAGFAPAGMEGSRRHVMRLTLDSPR